MVGSLMITSLAYRFSEECLGERILKIGQYLVKTRRCTFLTHDVSLVESLFNLVCSLCFTWHICIGLSRYIAITKLSIIAAFVEYLRQFLIDLNQIYKHSSVPQNTSPWIFWAFYLKRFHSTAPPRLFLSCCACHGVANPSTASH